MKAGLFYFYGLKNSGDMAINIGAIQILKSAGFESINMLSRFDKTSINYSKSVDFMDSHNEFFENTKLYPGPFKFERKNKIVELIKEYIKILITLRKNILSSEMNDFINESDILFFNGGNMLRINSTSDFFRMIALFIPVYLAKSKNKKVVLLPHSSNKMGRIGTWLTNQFLKKFDYIYTREDQTNSIFRNMGLQKSKSQIDMCFYKSVSLLKARQIPQNLSTVAITLRKSNIGDIGELSSNKIDILENYIGEFIKLLNQDNTKIIIVNQTKKDYEFSTEIYNKYKDSYDVELIEEYDTFSLSKIYSEVDFVFGMRLHSLILAASVGTPILGLFSDAWGVKNKGTMEMLKLKYIVVEENKESIEEIVGFNLGRFTESREIIMNKYEDLIDELKIIRENL